jgi:hypothetical protein
MNNIYKICGLVANSFFLIVHKILNNIITLKNRIIMKNDKITTALQSYGYREIGNKELHWNAQQ